MLLMLKPNTSVKTYRDVNTAFYYCSLQITYGGYIRGACCAVNLPTTSTRNHIAQDTILLLSPYVISVNVEMLNIAL